MPDELHKLFPLPTNTFERYMIGDDRESHPMAAFMEIEVRGTIDRERLVRAFEAAVDRHPLLRAGVRYNLLGLPYWVLEAPRPPDIAEWDVPLTCPGGERLDLTAGTGMRTWVRISPERARITIQVHHACSDALGKLTFLADWLTIYSRLGASDPSEPLPQPNWDAFRRRSQTPPVSREVRRSVKPPGILYDAYRFFHRRTARLPGVSFQQSNEEAPFSGLYGVSIDDEAFQRVRREARRQEVSVNDWLLAALYVAMAEWTEAHGGEHPRKVFRVTIPYSMRTAETINSPASNQIGYEILSHPMDAGKDFARLSREIARFTGPVRALRTSTFTKLLRASRIYSRFLPFPFATRYWAKSFATVIFSNLGDVSGLFQPLVKEQDGRWTFDDLCVEQIMCAPPTRVHTHLSIVVLSYAGRMHFISRCEGRVLAPSSIRGFLDHYRATVLGLVGIQEEEQEASPSAERTTTTLADSA